MRDDNAFDVAVVGGGLAGLAASVYLARAGSRVVLFEKSSQIGGRARTKALGGFYFNMGPHALYLSGAGKRVLRELGIRHTGGCPPLSLYGFVGNKPHYISTGLRSLLSTKLLSARSKFKAMRILSGLKRIDTEQLQATTWAEWLERQVELPDLSQLIQTMFRLFTYSNDPAIASVGPALEYFAKAYDRVEYIDGGWQTLVDGLRDNAVRAGVKLEIGNGVEAIEHSDKVNGVRLYDGKKFSVSAVVLALDPKTASRLISNGGEPEGFERWARESRPVKVAAFDVGLSKLPRPEVTYALGIDSPLYFSVHSKYARLAPGGSAAISLVKYLGTSIPSRPERDRADLEDFLDNLQPGWRRFLVTSRFLPEMVSSTALVEAAKGGLLGRPEPKSRSIDGLYFAGDWVGREGILSDSSLSSAEQAARQILAFRSKPRLGEQPLHTPLLKNPT